MEMETEAWGGYVIASCLLKDIAIIWTQVWFRLSISHKLYAIKFQMSFDLSFESERVLEEHLIYPCNTKYCILMVLKIFYFALGFFKEIFKSIFSWF